jgi:two-component system nitrate/nitrite response regulator NarL
MQINKHATIILADNHPMPLKGLYQELVSNNYRVIGQASNGSEALELILKLEPTLAILDIEMPFLTGFEVVKICKEKNIPTKFIIQSSSKEAEYIAQAKALNIQGYLLKVDSFSEIEGCINAVLKDENHYSNYLDNSLLLHITEELQYLKLLSPAESTILKLVSQQDSTNTIATHLSLSTRTVEKHRSNIINKLSLKGEANVLTSWAICNRDLISLL